MTRASPSVQEIVEMADRISEIALAGRVAELPGASMDLVYSAVPGAPGQGLQIFEDALHADVQAGVLDTTGAWRFWRRQISEGGRRGRLLATSDTPAGRPG